LVPFFMMLPGVIAYHLYGSGLESMDMAYPRLVSDVLPAYLSGFFLAVLLGAVLSSFNSLLNSAATLFTLDIYQPLVNRHVSDERLISVAKRASVVIAGFSFLAAPLLQFAPEGLWQVIRIFTGYYNIPIITIVLVGLFTQRVPAQAAKAVIVFHIFSYTMLKFVWAVELHFIHLYGILFVVELGIMLIIGWYNPRDEKPFVSGAQVDMTPWRFALPVSALLVGCIVGLYVLFSPVGLVGGAGSAMVGWMVVVAVASTALAALGWRFRSGYAQAVRRRFARE
ncbi:MAG: solute:sodium symporter family transporter, partial [Proteobacteria bacterium]|nr:solute:sodium symporter family transporter [Pseudomonadota bacterium]